MRYIQSVLRSPAVVQQLADIRRLATEVCARAKEARTGFVQDQHQEATARATTADCEAGGTICVDDAAAGPDCDGAGDALVEQQQQQQQPANATSDGYLSAAAGCRNLPLDSGGSDYQPVPVAPDGAAILRAWAGTPSSPASTTAALPAPAAVAPAAPAAVVPAAPAAAAPAAAVVSAVATGGKQAVASSVPAPAAGTVLPASLCATRHATTAAMSAAAGVADGKGEAAVLGTSSPASLDAAKSTTAAEASAAAVAGGEQAAALLPVRPSSSTCKDTANKLAASATVIASEAYVSDPAVQDARNKTESALVAVSDLLNEDADYSSHNYLGNTLLPSVSSYNLLQLQALHQLLTWLLQLPTEMILIVCQQDGWLDKMVQCWAAEVQQTGCAVMDAAAAAAE